MKIFTIQAKDAESFTQKVNLSIQNGWSLYGEPHICTVAEASTWDGSPYSRSVTTFIQIVKKD